MIERANKAMNYYRNHGLVAFASKTAYVSRHKVVSLIQGSNNTASSTSNELAEEYGFVTNRIFRVTEADIKQSSQTTKNAKLDKINTANWFIPNFNHISFGGIFTLFRFIEKFSFEGVKNRIIIYDNPSFNVSELEEQIRVKFPNLKSYEIIIFDHGRQDVDDLPACDIAICTFWVSAYLLAKFNKTKRKYYFVQDYEPLFYPGGSTYALAESTYRFGFRGIVNTPGLLAAVNQRHGMEGISFIPAVDGNQYYPDKTKANKRTKIFFYARPNNPRNAFNLGISIIKELIDKYGDKIEVVTAGAEWDEGAYGLNGKITNLGLLQSIDEVATLYRSCDIGFVYMLSKHPSYQPFEFMASGVATVSNTNEDNLWFLKDGVNCLLSEPSPAAMVEKISNLIDDNKLRTKIANNGLKAVNIHWPPQIDAVWNDIRNH